MSSQSSTKKNLGVIAAVVSAGVLVSTAAWLAVTPMNHLRHATSDAFAEGHSVTDNQSVKYCPARMSLADNAQYGDAQYQVSAGDLASSSRFVQWPQVYQSDNQSLDGQAIALNATAKADDAMMSTSLFDSSVASVLSSRVLNTQEPWASIGTTMSWATQGDLKGLSSSLCVPFARQHSFITTPTTTGWSAQLIIANSTDKSTSVSLKAYGKDSSSALNLATDASVVVEAHSEQVVDLAAALPENAGAFVTVSSQTAPIAAVIRSVSMSGLQSQGSEYIMPVVNAMTEQVIPALEDDNSQATVLGLYGETAGNVTVSAMTAQGLSQLGTYNLEASRVHFVELNNLPAGTRALHIKASAAVYSAVRTTRAHSGFADFFVMNGQQAHAYQAFTIPDQATAHVSLSNISDSGITVALTVYDASGRSVGTRDITLGAHSAQVVALSDIASDAAVVTVRQTGDGDAHVVAGLKLSNSALSQAQVVGLAAVPGSAVELKKTEITVHKREGIVN